MFIKNISNKLFPPAYYSRTPLPTVKKEQEILRAKFANPKRNGSRAKWPRVKWPQGEMAPGRNSPRATCLQGEMATRPSRRASRPKRKRFSKRGKLNLPFVAFPRRKQKRERPRSLRCQASSSCFLGTPLSKDTALVLVYQSERTRSRVLSYDAAWRPNFFLGSFNY